MNIYISTANQCLHLIKPFAYLFNKFWTSSQQVTILGYDAPTFELPDNFKFISLGKQEGGIKMWSTDLRKFFKSIDDEFFIWATEDQFLTMPVNFDILKKLISLLNKNVGRVGLAADMPEKPYDFVEQMGTYNVTERRQTAEYRLSAIFSIWNREYLLKYMLPGWSPWEFEIHGSNMAMNDGYKILGTVGNHAIRQCCAVRKGNLNAPLDFRFISETTRRLDNESIDEMRKKGIIDEENRISN